MPQARASVPGAYSFFLVRKTAAGPGDVADESCECCVLVGRHLAAGDLYAFKHWTLNTNDSCRPRPNLVLQVIDHVPNVDELNEHELAELGSLLSKLLPALESHLGKDARAYFSYMNEGNDIDHRHVHVHLLARFPADAHGDPAALLRSRWAPNESEPPARILASVAEANSGRLVPRR